MCTEKKFIAIALEIRISSAASALETLESVIADDGGNRVYVETMYSAMVVSSELAI